MMSTLAHIRRHGAAENINYFQLRDFGREKKNRRMDLKDRHSLMIGGDRFLQLGG